MTKHFGGLTAVNKVSLSIEQGAVHSLIGPNGSGKSTCLNLINGLYPLDGGTIELEGKRVNGLRPHRIAQMGISRTFQNIRLFENLTVLENVMVGQHHRYDAGFMATVLRAARAKETEQRFREKAEETLAFLGLAPYARVPATSLAYGQRRMVEIARALVMEPKVLLLDEPAAGLNSTEILTLSEQIKTINSRGITVLLVEHNMRVVMAISDYITVLDFGSKIAEGLPAEIQNNERVIEAYLGDIESFDQLLYDEATA
jgi:branched-chain amino acid transport system ATP-binding protein